MDYGPPDPGPFAGPSRAVSVVSAGEGLTSTEALAAAGITYRQLDNWVRQGWVRPSIREAAGSGAGRIRLWSEDDVWRLRTARALIACGLRPSAACATAARMDPAGGDALAVNADGPVQLAWEDVPFFAACQRDPWNLVSLAPG